MVIFGASAPLGLITPVLRKAGVRRAIAITHGHEAGWAALPVARGLLRRIGEETDVVTYLGDYFRVRLAAALTPEAAARMTRLHPGVDAATFRPDPRARAAIRERYGLGDRPVVVCVSRLVPRKGQDTLLRAWPAVLAAVPDAALLIVSGGPYAAALHRLAEQAGVAGAVRFTGPVPQARTARALRRGRRLRDALPHQARRPGRGGPRHRLPGGVRDGPARRRRRLRRRTRRDPATARPATWSAAATSTRCPPG